MRLNIIHGNRHERLSLLKEQLDSQNIWDYKIWDGEHCVDSVVRSINLSHKKIVQYAKDNDLSEICIAEDDIKFTHPNSFNYFLENKPDSFDMYLGGCYLPEFNPNQTLKSFCALHLYIISERFYDIFLALPEREHLDRAMAGLGVFILCNPMVAVQSNGFSQNTGKEENYDRLIYGYEIYKG